MILACCLNNKEFSIKMAKNAFLHGVNFSFDFFRL